MKMKPSRAGLAFFAFVAVLWCASACENTLTISELTSDRARGIGFVGPSFTAFLGSVVNGLGDVNGDGFADIAIAAPHHESAGVVYIVFGRSAAAWSTATFNLSAPDTPDPASWIKIGGDTSSMQLGSGGIASGDFNGDGVSDFLVSARTLGKVFVVFGRSGAWSSFNISQVEGGAVPGFAISGLTGTYSFVGNAGDLNGDGIEDLLVSVVDSSSSTSTAYVVFGVAGATRSTFSVNTVDGTNGFKLADGSGSLGYRNALCSAGDVNGDGLADLAIGSYSANNNAGRAYTIFARNVSASGQWPDSIDLSSFLDGTNGFVVDGASSSSQFGYTVTGAGDVNGDGFADVYIGTNFASEGAWIVFGHPAPWTTPLSVLKLDGTNGFHFASFPDEHWGSGAGDGIGDYNNDGIDDIAIGGLLNNMAMGFSMSAAVVIFGRAGKWPAMLDRNDTFGATGFFISGSAQSSFASVSGAGDVNGDGIADFIMGSPNVNFDTGHVTLAFGVDDHCAVCSNTSDSCLVCDDGFILNGTVCEAIFTPSSSAQQGVSVVVIIRFLENVTDPTELQEEIASVLGIDAGLVSVVVISPTEVEVTIIGSEETAQHLVDIINNGGTGSDGSGLGLLRKATDAHIRKDTDGSSDDDGVDAASHVVLFHFVPVFIVTVAALL